MTFNVKSEILSAIGKTNDENMKMLLLLMLGVLEEIGGKVDTVLNNENALRGLVLNGHAPIHHDHHNWIEKRIARDGELEPLIRWAAEKVRQESEDHRNVRKMFLDAIGKGVLYLMIGGIGAFVGMYTK